MSVPYAVAARADIQQEVLDIPDVPEEEFQKAAAILRKYRVPSPVLVTDDEEDRSTEGLSEPEGTLERPQG